MADFLTVENPVSEREQQFMAIAQHEFARASKPLKRLNDVAPILAASYQRHDNLIHTTLATSTEALACRAGCAYCCHYKVEARAAEIFAVKRWMLKQWSEAEVAAATARITAHAEKVLSITEQEHLSLNMPCPLLVDQQCSVYEARPFRCRNFHSTSASSCEASFHHPEDMEQITPLIDAVAIAADAHTQGVEAAIAQAGADNRVYDFTSALAEALTSEAAEKRYLKGKKAFQQAREVS